MPKISRIRLVRRFPNAMLLTLKTASRLSHLRLIAWRLEFRTRYLRPRLVVAELTFLRNLLVEAPEFQFHHHLPRTVIVPQCPGCFSVMTFPFIKRL